MSLPNFNHSRQFSRWVRSELWCGLPAAIGICPAHRRLRGISLSIRKLYPTRFNTNCNICVQDRNTISTVPPVTLSRSLCATIIRTYALARSVSPVRSRHGMSHAILVWTAGWMAGRTLCQLRREWVSQSVRIVRILLCWQKRRGGWLFQSPWVVLCASYCRLKVILSVKRNVGEKHSIPANCTNSKTKD